MDIPLFVSSDQISSERRISPTWTIQQLKAKLEPITGIPPENQSLVLYGPNESSKGTDINDTGDGKTVGQYSPVPYGRLHVLDTRPPCARLNLDDDGSIERYILPEDEYDKRQDSVRAWKKRNQLGRFDPNAQKSADQDAERSQQLVDEKRIKVGARCLVSGSNRGTVQYVGQVPEIAKIRNDAAPRIWVGIEYDEPVGKHDGTIEGTRYFIAKNIHGAFIKPDVVDIGDYPEEDFDEL